MQSYTECSCVLMYVDGCGQCREPRRPLYILCKSSARSATTPGCNSYVVVHMQELMDSLDRERSPQARAACSDPSVSPQRLAELQAAVEALERENAALRGAQHA